MPRAFGVKMWVGVLAAVLAGAGCSAPTVRSPVVLLEPAQRSTTEPKHVQFLRDLDRLVSPGSTSYRHSDAQVRLSSDGSSLCHADCSSLLNKVFEQTLGVDEASIRAWLGRKRPRAREYFESISSERGFRIIKQIRDIEVGDVIAIRYESGASNTGHVMVVNAPPRLSEQSQPRVDGATAWEVDVIDCSATGHGPGDSRLMADGAFHAGLGRGTIRLYIDSSGQCIGHTFTMSAAAPFRSAEQRPIVVGRVTIPPMGRPPS